MVKSLCQIQYSRNYPRVWKGPCFRFLETQLATLYFWCVVFGGTKGVSVFELGVVCLSGTKLSQAKKFNDPDDPCKILVATDAIGMGLNL